MGILCEIVKFPWSSEYLWNSPRNPNVMFYAQHKISAEYIVFTALDNQAQEKFYHQGMCQLEQ